ncbi:MAG: cytidylate kinase family protein [Eubacteriales bacterium]|nr:cytidylate kinase family protein [Eubacteriales bacterium]
MPIITISRQIGSLGDEIAQALAQELGWDLIDRSQLIDRFFKDTTDARERHLLTESARFFLNTASTGVSYLDQLQRGLFQLAGNHSLILLGFGSQVIFSDHPQAIHVRITAPLDVRLARVAADCHVTHEQAEQMLETADRRHRRFVQTVFEVDSADETLYHQMLNTGYLSVRETVDVIVALLQIREIHAAPETTQPSVNPSPLIPFKNTSEAEFAKILDMHQIQWAYEPKTFPVEWDAEGNVTLAFSPDFYLTQFDTYIELTTMNQKYVTEKNKKLRRVRELYPGTHIKIVYKRDFAALIERFSQFSS